MMRDPDTTHNPNFSRRMRLMLHDTWGAKPSHTLDVMMCNFCGALVPLDNVPKHAQHHADQDEMHP